jgi:hypothetical protein
MFRQSNGVSWIWCISCVSPGRAMLFLRFDTSVVFLQALARFFRQGSGAMANSAIHTDSNQPAYNHHSTSLGVYSLFLV